MRRRRGRPVSGVLLLDKPAGVTSNQALQTLGRGRGVCPAQHVETHLRDAQIPAHRHLVHGDEAGHARVLHLAQRRRQLFCYGLCHAARAIDTLHGYSVRSTVTRS